MPTEARPLLGGGTLKLTETPLSLPSFPSEHFGKLFGLVMALSAIVSLLQFPIFILIKGPLQNDPFYVSTLGTAGILAFDHAGWGNSVGPQQGAPPNLKVP